MAGTGRAVAAAVLLAAVAVTARLALQPEADAVGQIRNPAWLPSGKALRLASLGQRLVLADLYWLKLVQYVGERVMGRETSWEALYPLADITTDLDPRYGYAYQVAGSNLAGLAHRYADADRILQKGMRNVPDRWSLAFVYAANKFIYEEKYAEAAEYARRAAEVGKRPHLALLAANLSLLADQGDEYRASVAFLEEAISQAETPELREQLEERLVKVRTYEVLSRVEHAVAAFRESEVRRPFGLGELVARGYLREVPRDPSGGRILFDLVENEVRSSVLGPRRPLKVNR